MHHALVAVMHVEKYSTAEGATEGDGWLEAFTSTQQTLQLWSEASSEHIAWHHPSVAVMQMDMKVAGFG